MDERATCPSGQGSGMKSAVHSALSPHITEYTIRDFRPPERPSNPQRRLVAGYELLEELGQGGMGVVYLARQVQLGRLVALKMIRSPSADREDLVRFRTEAEAVARLSHPNIVQIHEIGEHDGIPFFSLEFCAGGPLDRHLAGRPMPPRQAAGLVQTLARAVHHAHENGVVHRDLKPANVLLASPHPPAPSLTEGRGGEKQSEAASHAVCLSPPLPPWERGPGGDGETVPKIADFGLAKRLDHPDRMTRVGAVVGTPPYMAPEQAAGQNDRIGPATDIWALGTILYECLAGRPPFQTDSVFQTLEQIRQHEPISPRTLNLAVPRDLETICLKCLQKEPGKRYRSAEALGDDLGRWLQGEPIVARPAGRLERAAKWARRRPTAAALLSVSILLAGVLLAAAPLHIARLRAKVDEARAEAVRAYLLAECGQRLTEGREALARRTSQDVQAAHVLFATVIKDITDEDARTNPALARLRDEARALEQRARELDSSQTDRVRARERAQHFLKLRDEVFFELYRDELAGRSTSRPPRSRELARCALTNFPDMASLPIDEARELGRAREEVLLLLAEGTARTDQPEAQRQALAMLDRLDEQAARHSINTRRARCLALLGRTEEAEREQAKASRVQPAGSLDWFLVGLDHWRAGNVKAARNDFDRALEAEPESFWPRFFRALVLRRLGDGAEARADAIWCARVRRDYPWAHLLCAYLQVEAGKLIEAGKSLDRAERCFLDTSAQYALLTNRGVLALRRGQPRRAVDYFQRAALLLPDCHLAHAHLAQGYRQRGQHERAVASLDHAIRLAPTLAELHRVRAELHYAFGRPALALRDLDAAIRLSPAGRASAELALDYRERARILYTERRFGDALVACRETLKRSADDPVAMRLEAESLLELDRPHEALAAYDRYLKKRKADVELHRRRARARASLGDLGGVVDEYSAALTLRHNAPLLAARGWAYLLNAAPRPALRDFKTALVLDPENGDALSGRGAARVELGDYRGGTTDAEAALRCGPRSSRHLYNIARVLARAAAMAPSDRHAPAWSARAMAVLRDAVMSMPEARRPRFWSDLVRRDSAFQALARTTGFIDLDRKFGSRASR
jgi:serine/threonine protein kinase/tetratricopeptide (TPR) repeat protein